MMTIIRIWQLWAMWLVWCSYDIVVSLIGAFPDHTPRERMLEDISLALFIGAVWISSIPARQKEKAK